ncbi:MAG: DUF3570 domain-containing protein [Halieaceae bacterium]
MAATRLLLLLVLLAGTWQAQAVTLPVERGDAMYHRYDGGGVTIDGPSVLMRKNFAETVSVSGNYYVDNVSSASIDVITSGASEYSEQRTEYSLGGDYLHGKSIFSAGYTHSDESDYTADTYYAGISQDFFGDLTNISFGYSRGDDTVEQNGNDAFSEEIDRHNYRVGISQILRPNLIMAFNYEAITDEGYLNNPYRTYRYLSDPLDPSAGFQQATEVYPNTRTSDAAGLKFLYHLPWRATLGSGYRYFTDDWGIDANTAHIGYTHVLWKHFILDLGYRYYKQDGADFYSDMFLVPSQDEKDYRARDKELSDFDSHTLSAYLSYERPLSYSGIEKVALSLQWDRMYFNYDNFSDLRDQSAVPGEEKLYELDADVFKVLFTLWY